MFLLANPVEHSSPVISSSKKGMETLGLGGQFALFF